MKAVHSKLKSYAIREGVDVREWDKSSPHFGGHAGHRYQAQAREYVKTRSVERVCVYCLRPENLLKDGAA